MMKKISIILVMLFWCNVGHAQSVSALIQNATIDDVKSKLIDTHLDQGYDIEEETNNKITFVKEVKGFTVSVLMGLLSDDVRTYQRDKFNFSKKDSGVKVYYSTELFSADKIVKLKGKSTLEVNQKWINTWVGKNF